MPTYTANKPLRPNTPISILERDEHGGLIGAYNGYWDFRHQLVRLYPDMRHPFVRWRGTPHKKIINDSLVRVETSSASQKPQARSSREGYIKSQTSRLRKLPIEGFPEASRARLGGAEIEGQEKMKF